ncbi:MAG: formylglycine-generating enzyme family protein [Deinococcales bacterium]
MQAKSCCTPARDSSQEALTPTPRQAVACKHPPEDPHQHMSLIPTGTFLMGSEDKTFPADGEGPVREVLVNRFWIDRYAVTNKAFSYFVEATNYITEAERFGWSYVFHLFLPKNFPPTHALPAAPWWRQVFGASWRCPEGPQSNLESRECHPVVHISWHDAKAYADWLGKRLPSEAEWEYAARGGLIGQRYPWGQQLMPKGKHRCNIWQGTFPTHNSQKDGYLGTCPVDSFEANGYGLYNVVGNVWEWCQDWFSADHHLKASKENPKGPEKGMSKVLKGGSYLCHASYCNRYRVAARTHNTPDSSTGHMGFRLVKDATLSSK